MIRDTLQRFRQVVRLKRRSPLRKNVDAMENRVHDLPVEVSFLIFSSLTSFRDVTALASASRCLHDIWRSNGRLIANAILLSTVPCYTDALALAEAQEFAAAQFRGDNATEWARMRVACKPLTSTQLRLICNKQIADKALQYFLDRAVNEELTRGVGMLAMYNNHARQSTIVSPHRNPAYLTTSEQERFYCAFYRVSAYKAFDYSMVQEGRERQKAILCITEYWRPADDVQAARALEEHWRLCEMAWFLLVEIDTSMRQEIYRNPNYEMHDTSWSKTLGDIFENYRKTLMSLGHDGNIPRHDGCPKELYMALFDPHQSRTFDMALDIVQRRRTDW